MHANASRPVRRRLKTEPLHHVPALDGLRAVAVVLVLLYHSGFGWMSGGFLGVSVFFTLSGFLITSLLLREWNEHSGIDGRRFWVRRFRRLTPAAWATLAGVLVLAGVGVWDSEQLRALRSDLPWSLVDLVNWHFIASGTSYGDSFTAPSPLEHFWSLAVETQFYAALLLVTTGCLVVGRGASHRARLSRLVKVLVALTVASALANLWLARTSIDRAYFGTDSRAAEMLIGALLACVTLRRLRLPASRARDLTMWAGGAGLVAVVWLSHAASLSSRWLYPWGLLATAVCTAALIAALLQEGRLADLLSRPAVVWLGRVSYGVYVVHWPVFLWLTPHRTGLGAWPLLALRLLVTIPVAAAMFRYVEQPVRTRRWPVPSTATSWLLAPLSVVALVAGTMQVTGNLPPPPSYLQTRAQDELLVQEAAAADGDVPDVEDAVTDGASNTTTTVPGPRPPERVLLIGDSIAASLETALGEALAARGISFASAATPGCGVIPGQPASGLDTPIRELNGSDIASCGDGLEQRQLDAVERFDPDLVLSMSTWESIDRIVEGVWYEFGTAESDELLTELHRQTYGRLAAKGAAVAWVLIPDAVTGRVTPPGQPSPEVLERAEHHRELLRQIASVVQGSTTLDLSSIVCPSTPCPTMVEGVELRPQDGLHYDDPPGARYVATRLAESIHGLDLNLLDPGGV